MTPAVYNYKSAKKGETIKALQVTASTKSGTTTTAMDLTNVEIKMDFLYKGATNTKVQKSEGSGITVTDAANGQFTIDAFTLNQVGTWEYDLQFTFSADSTVFTYLKGAIEIFEDITR